MHTYIAILIIRDLSYQMHPHDPTLINEYRQDISTSFVSDFRSNLVFFPSVFIMFFFQFT